MEKINRISIKRSLRMMIKTHGYIVARDKIESILSNISLSYEVRLITLEVWNDLFKPKFKEI